MRLTLKRVGSMWHWRIGRIGGSFYIAKRRTFRQPRTLRAAILKLRSV